MEEALGWNPWPTHSLHSIIQGAELGLGVGGLGSGLSLGKSLSQCRFQLLTHETEVTVPILLTLFEYLRIK